LRRREHERVASVSASDSGIGQESAKELVENGFHVGITSVHEHLPRSGASFVVDGGLRLMAAELSS
jgi:hypothetical protein